MVESIRRIQKQVDNLKIIALTATPPYDSTPAMWTRYMNMCGEIDEEITIPELVKREASAHIRIMFTLTIRQKRKNRKSDVFRNAAKQ